MLKRVTFVTEKIPSSDPSRRDLRVIRDPRQRRARANHGNYQRPVSHNP